MIVRKMLYIPFIVLSFNVVMHATAQEDNTLSPAEQAALQIHQPQTTEERLVKMCHHILLHGEQAKKSQLLEVLGEHTCQEAVTNGTLEFGQSEQAAP